MDENRRRRDWKSGKDVEISWSLGPKQDPLEMLHGSPMLLKERKEVSQIKSRINGRATSRRWKKIVSQRVFNYHYNYHYDPRDKNIRISTIKIV
jgi:hypothetical protein